MADRSDTDYDKQRQLWHRLSGQVGLQVCDLETTGLFFIADEARATRIVIIPSDEPDVLRMGEALQARGYGYSQVALSEQDIQPVSSGAFAMLRDWGFCLL